MTCQICDKENPSFAWTYTYGVAQCLQCGAPYRLYHYVDNKRVDKEPTLEINPKYIPLLRRYYKETKRIMPGGHSFPDGYEVASEDDKEAFYDWMKKNDNITPLEESAQK